MSERQWYRVKCNPDTMTLLLALAGPGGNALARRMLQQKGILHWYMKGDPND